MIRSRALPLCCRLELWKCSPDARQSALNSEVHVKTYQFLWQLIRYRPWLYLLNATLWTLVHLSPLVPGLIIREFFDTLSGDSARSWTIGALIALLVTTALVRVLVIAGGAIADPLHRFTMSALLRRNLFIYGLGGVAIPFVGIKLIDMVVTLLL